MDAPGAAPSALRIATLTVVAMIAFAANSLLCRIALAHGTIDAASFSSIRLLAGALALALMLRLRRAAPVRAGADGWAAVMLFAYVALFSFAYLTLAAGTGALIPRGLRNGTGAYHQQQGRGRLPARRLVRQAAQAHGSLGQLLREEVQ